MKCKVCGTDVNLKKDNHYVAKEINILTGKESLWDCFDCPKCGCQVIASKRLEKVERSDAEH